MLVVYDLKEYNDLEEYISKASEPSPNIVGNYLGNSKFFLQIFRNTE